MTLGVEMESSMAGGAVTAETGSGAISVIVIVGERAQPLAQLYEEYAPPLRKLGRECEFLFVTEPGNRDLTAPLAGLLERGESVRALEMGQALGETVLLKLAVTRCRGEVVVTLPAYRRIEANAVPALVAAVDAGADLAIAWRWPRADAWINRLQNGLLHRVLGGLGGDRIHDVASGVRAMRRGVLQQVPLYGDFWRFFPLVALRAGYRVEEVQCRQHPSDREARFYGPGVYLRRLIDLLGLVFLLRFTEKPLRFFGLIGSALSGVGMLVLVVTFFQRLAGERGLADRPLLLLGVLCLVLGVQAIALGLIGEMIVHLHASRRSTYRLWEGGEV